jgi:hypothetical protein
MEDDYFYFKNRADIVNDIVKKQPTFYAIRNVRI